MPNGLLLKPQHNLSKLLHAALVLPNPISKKEIDAAWLLGAYKTLLETMAGIDDGDAEPEEETPAAD